MKHALLLAICAMIIVSTAWPQPLTAAAQATPYSQNDIVERVNEYRLSSGHDPIHVDVQLQEAAQTKLDHMKQHQYWGHYAPDGTGPWEFIHETGFSYNRAGENLAIGFMNDERLVDAWIASPEHEAVLSGDYQNVGIAIEEASLPDQDGVLVVAMFAHPSTSFVDTAAQGLQSISASIVQSFDNLHVRHPQVWALSIW